MTKEIFLLSDKSCGSTILEYEILKHSKIKAVEYTSHHDHETLYWVKAAVFLKKSKNLFFGSKYPFPFSYSKKSLEKFIQKNTNKKVTIKNKEDLVNSWREISNKEDSIFFEKSPHHLNHKASMYLIADYVNSNPNVKVIGLVRDPRAVIYSTLTRWFANPIERQFKWFTSFENLLIFKNLLKDKSQLISIRYEDLTENSSKILKDVIDFLEIEWEDQIGSDFHSKSKEKWKENNFKFNFSQEIIQIAKLYGYDLEYVKASEESYKLNYFSPKTSYRLLRAWFRKIFNYYITKK